MKFQETLRIDENFLIDEERKTFCYKEGGEYVFLPAKNIQLCFLEADVDSISEDYFYVKEVTEIGKVHFIKDLNEFSKAILSGNSILVTQFLDENNEMRCHRKRYLTKDKTLYEIMSKIDKLICHK